MFALPKQSEAQACAPELEASPGTDSDDAEEEHSEAARRRGESAKGPQLKSGESGNGRGADDQAKSRADELLHRDLG